MSTEGKPYAISDAGNAEDNVALTEAWAQKPLHVRVAEALGCKPESNDPYAPKNGQPVAWVCGCQKHHTDGIARHSTGTIYNRWLAHYDTDWAATGPLIQTYGLTIGLMDEAWSATRQTIGHLEAGGYYGPMSKGPTPLIAICNLILALHAAGKLKEAV